MSGAAAGGAAGAQGAQGAPAQGEASGGEGEGTGPDFAAMSQQLESIGPVMEQMREFLQSEPWQQQETPAAQEPAAAPEMDLSWLDADNAAIMEPEQLQQHLSKAIQEQVKAGIDKGLEQHVNPLAERVAEQQRVADVNALLGEFPEIAEDGTREQVLGAAGQLAEQFGHPEMANDPKLWRAAYLMGRALDAAAEESDDVPAPAHLESGSGGLPSGSGGQDFASQIINAGRGSDVLPFG